MKFFDDKMKNVHWWNKNLFFLGTLLIIGANVALFYFLGPEWSNKPSLANWGDMFSFNNLINNFLSAFDHFTMEHLILNMICFFMVSIRLNRVDFPVPLAPCMPMRSPRFICKLKSLKTFVPSGKLNDRCDASRQCLKVNSVGLSCTSPPSSRMPSPTT